MTCLNTSSRCLWPQTLIIASEPMPKFEWWFVIPSISSECARVRTTIVKQDMHGLTHKLITARPRSYNSCSKSCCYPTSSSVLSESMMTLCSPGRCLGDGVHMGESREDKPHYFDEPGTAISGRNIISDVLLARRCKFQIWPVVFKFF